jgi:hypothetical protein
LTHFIFNRKLPEYFDMAAPTPAHLHWGNFAGLLLAFCLTLFAVAAWPAGRFVLVVARPDAPVSRVMDIIGDAGGSFVAPGRFPWIAVAYSDTGDFPQRLFRAGALIVLNHALSAGCLHKDR